MAFKTMKEVRKYLDEVHRKLQEVPDGNFFKLADKLGLDVLHDFAKSDLSNTDLSNGNLENADLSHANLSNADLSGANLKNANLSHAILFKADLSGADLSGANLLNAVLRDTNFSEAKYDSATKFLEGFSPPAQEMEDLQSLEVSQDLLERKNNRRLSSSDQQLGVFNGQAIVEEAILPDQVGRVRFKASRWLARSDQPLTIASGELVDVIGVQNITLLVEPAVLLTASKIGLARLQTALMQNDRLFPAESVAPAVAQSEAQIAMRLAEIYQTEPIALETWQRFVSGKPLSSKTFKLCCQVLNLGWQKLVGYSDGDATLELAVEAGEATTQQLRVSRDEELGFV